jgi:hypothetical protein
MAVSLQRPQHLLRIISFHVIGADSTEAARNVGASSSTVAFTARRALRSEQNQ